MKIDRFGFQKKFAVNTSFLDETLIMEGSVEEDNGETWEEATIKGRNRMIALVKSFAPSVKPEEIATTYGPPPTIQTEKGGSDDPLYLIQNAPTMEVLATFKIIAGADKTLYEAYCSRMKELQ